MSILVLIMFIIGALPISICLYTFFCRMILCMHPAMEKRNDQILCAMLTLICILLFFIGKGTWLLTLFHLMAFILIFQFLHFVLYRITKTSYPSLDKLYRFGVLPLLCTMIWIGYGLYNMQQLERTDYTITTEKNLEASFRIALLSDVHYGNALHQTKLEEYVEKINQEQADMVVLAGDIVDESTTYEEMREVFDTLGKLKSTYGIFYVYGNHDESMYRTSPAFSEMQLREAIHENGILILEDEAYRLRDDIMLIGRKDASLSKEQGRKSSMELRKDANPQDFLILLDHQPKGLRKNDEAGYDLQLSGHTHGGQIWPVGIVAKWFGFMEVDYGYRTMEHMQVVVTSGLSGWGFPLRTQVHNEYVILDIVSDGNE